MSSGGKSPQIIFDDADFEAALPVVINAITQNAGQTCSAGSRVMIQENIFDDFVSALGERIGNLVAGAHEKDLNCGPLISAKQLERVTGFIAECERGGSKLIARASIDVDAPEGGYYVAPALYGPVAADSMLAQKEVFGPILAALLLKTKPMLFASRMTPSLVLSQVSGRGMAPAK